MHIKTVLASHRHLAGPNPVQGLLWYAGRPSMDHHRKPFVLHPQSEVDVIGLKERDEFALSFRHPLRDWLGSQNTALPSLGTVQTEDEERGEVCESAQFQDR